ncbi:4'-phosphopantetheinyl transferase superfamily protein [Kribbella antibiotica]|uniref:4'-phosphopantetheinyl transferase superfamily protein n=1 Tax=Kribbella antibiotica TaxID=190195 RepID=A0A4V2YPA8_9ACTN|nr:4'-phosphopantetheinyl transferase superfamily protein [Kribbella antibiotica]
MREPRPSSGYLLSVGDAVVDVWTAPAGDDSRATAHALLLSLARTLIGDPVLTHSELGRPEVAGLAVSISHSHSLVAVAARRTGVVGIDVEDVYPRDVSGLARRWFDPAELEWMDGDLLAFLQLWTAKEAVGKALGQGLRNSGLRRRMPLIDGPVESLPGFHVVRLPLEGAVLAVALDEPPVEIVLTEHHDTALRSTVRSRTSFPVVVRGN